MKVNFITGMCILFFSLISCEIEEPTLLSAESGKLEGYWVNRQFQDTLQVFKRSDKLLDNEYGIAFLADGQFLERKNAGWCGTPPIAYDDFTGTWSHSDSVIDVETGYWGGTAVYRWQLISAGEDSLKIKVISEDYFQQN